MIKHAAIKKDNIVYVGHRHPDCIRVMADCGLAWPVTKGAVQGFVTEGGTFVNRQQAVRIARECGQLIGRKKHGSEDKLYSEDVY